MVLLIFKDVLPKERTQDLIVKVGTGVEVPEYFCSRLEHD